MLSEILQEQLNKSCNCRVKENDTNSLKLKSESTSQGIDRMNEFEPEAKLRFYKAGLVHFC